jgi:Ca2+-binding RTX toxin-like protein
VTADSGGNELRGGEGNDVLLGGNWGDLLLGEAGDDTAYGGAGGDTIHGGTGNDRLHGEDGDDVIDGQEDNDLLTGGNGRDILLGFTGNDTMWGGEGDDELHGWEGDDWQAGEAGHDYIVGQAGNDWAAGGTGNNRMYGGTGNDQFHGEDGDDTIGGEDGDDLLTGGTGNDILSGGWGSDKLFGDAGADWLIAGDFDADAYWRIYPDVAAAGAPALRHYIDFGFREGRQATVTADSGGNELRGGDGNDVLLGGGDNDQLHGESGNDTLIGEAGDDLLTGGDDSDTLYGGNDNDTLYGGNGDDWMAGEAGDNTLTGDQGNDYIDGGVGYDTALFAGNWANYAITVTGVGSASVVDLAAWDGADTGADAVAGMERLSFTDRIVYLDGSQGWGPLVVDLDGDGIELTDAFSSTVRFDMSGDGVADRTGWAAADDALLVFDIGGDRRITDQAEVVLSVHGEDGMGDLAALAHAFDDNRDGVFDAADSRWKDFGLWRDADQDGKTSDGEFRTLEEAGLVRIGLDAQGSERVVAGNIVHALASYETADGGKGCVGDVTLFAQAGHPSEAAPVAANDDVVDFDSGMLGLVAAMAQFDASTAPPEIETHVVIVDFLTFDDAHSHDALARAA